MLTRRWGSSPRSRMRQGLLPGFERSRRRERIFKVVISATTLALAVCAIESTTAGRSLRGRLQIDVPEGIRQLLGYPPSRQAIDARLRLERQNDVDATTALYERVVRESPESLQHLLRISGLAPGEALLCWGDFHHTLLLSRDVHQRDDRRSYRLRPSTRSIWLRRLAIKHAITGVLLVRDTPEIRAAAIAAGGHVVEDSVQTTNSWGLRGPEPNLDAQLRVLVLGDSFMQGMYLGDKATPPAQLEQVLRRLRGPSVCVLNAGHVGYAIEQYAWTFEEYRPRFHPNAVVVSICINDLGDRYDPRDNGGPEWQEARYWLDRIKERCRLLGIPCLVAIIPTQSQVHIDRRHPFFPGLVANLTDGNPGEFCNPQSRFIDQNLRLHLEAFRRDQGYPHSALYLGHLGDGHFSPAGASLWAEIIGHRLNTLIDLNMLRYRKRPERVEEPGQAALPDRA